MITRKLEKVAVSATRAVWPLVKKWNAAFERESFRAKWAPAPLLKSRERSFPPLGWPRTTDSLCPRCVKETREAVLSGQADLSLLVEGKPGEVKAEIVERGGKILMEKTCAKHGHFSDVIAIDPKFLSRIESLFFGRDFKSPETPLRNH